MGQAATSREPFWRTKRLAEMNRAEWESLCDGCGKCCLHKLEDIDSGDIAFTNVACRLLDTDTCRCSNYPERFSLVEDCVHIPRDNFDELRWMPTTCAYRLLFEGKPLPDWHPLISGDPLSVQRAGISVAKRVVSEQYIHEDDLRQRLVTWVKANE